MDKLKYLAKTLSRTKRKDYENYVVNAVWNRLGDDSVKPVSQQWLSRGYGRGYFIDLYFPQVNIGIECDELFHKGQRESDEARELDLIDILSAIDDEHGYEAIHIDISQGYESVERQIDGAVKRIAEAIRKRRQDGTFEEWLIDPDPEEFFRQRGGITVGDNIGFPTIRETCNTLFGTAYEHDLRMCHFTPRGPFREHFGGRYKVWFPSKAAPDGSGTAGWTNLVSRDGRTIYEFRDGGIEGLPEHEDIQRVVFVRAQDPITGVSAYRFLGVFWLVAATELEGKPCRKYLRTAEEFPVLGRGMGVLAPAQRKRVESMISWLSDIPEDDGRAVNMFVDEIGSFCREMGWEMDCGHAFGELYGVLDELPDVAGRIGDPALLGSAIHSQWRYMTHWDSWGGDIRSDRYRLWFITAFKRLLQLDN